MNKITREEYEVAFKKFEELYDADEPLNEQLTNQMLDLVEFLEAYENQEELNI